MPGDHGEAESFRPALRGVACARYGVAGPCWGQVEWVEVRDLLRGRCQRAICEGHRGAVYRPEPKAVC